MTALEDAIRAIRKIETQAELNQLTEVWKMQSTYIGNKNKRGLKIGDLVNWESRGFVKSGKIRKINRKTMEIVEPNNGGWGRTVYKVPASMVIGKVEE